MLVDFIKLPTESSELQLVQDKVYEAFLPLVSNPVNDSILLENVAIYSAQINRIPHKLNRKLRGWTVRRVNALCMIAENTATTDEAFLDLITSADCTVSIEVF